jgi:transcription-repair coupling factor (superfamily II helicase)
VSELISSNTIPSVDTGRPVVITDTPDYLINLVSDAFSIKNGLQVRARVYSNIEEIGVLRSNELVIAVGSTLEASLLSDLGYRKTERVWEEGEYSLLGDVIIIWERESSNPVRISLWGQKVESIDVIDRITRVSIGPLKSITIGAGKTTDSKVLRSYISNLSSESKNTLDLIFVHTPFNPDEYTSLYSILELGLKSIPGLQVYSDSSQLQSILKLYRSQGYKVVVIASDEEEIPEDVKYDRFLPRDRKTPSRGFVNTKNRSVYLTDAEIFGQIDLLGPKATVNRYEEIFKRLTPGDYVVHQDHGIAIFHTVVEQNGNLYLELHYADKDKLLVPLEQGDKVDRYLGAGRGRPALTGLGGNSWRRIRKKARVEAVKIARELIQLYAMRNIVKTEEVINEDVAQEVRNFADEFMYEDTEDQKVITEQILNDLASAKPMDRLIVGDVGFGKTELAIRAAYGAVLAGKQVAFLAPTTVLVEQHASVFADRLSGKGVRIDTLSRLRGGGERNKVLSELEKGKVDIIIGTHALLSDEVQFKDLGLLIIDEEQKFGVKQKEKMKEKRLSVHVLSLTATPIPRTLNMALNKIKDMSVLASVPPGRKPIKNYFEKFTWEVVKEAVKKEIKRGGQVYFLHNRVRDIGAVLEKLKKLLPEISIEVIHGQMSSALIASSMRRFASKESQLLLCTTIIENGIDLPNVNTLIVEGSENFGLSQLYQIRGRIGRSDRQAYAYFLYGAFLGESASRLAALKEADYLGSGFILSNRDLEIRGVGDILGESQSGAINAVGYAMYSKILDQEVAKIRKSSSE